MLRLLLITHVRTPRPTVLLPWPRAWGTHTGVAGVVNAACGLFNRRAVGEMQGEMQGARKRSAAAVGASSSQKQRKRPRACAAATPPAAVAVATRRRKPGPRRSTCRWYASTTCTHCHCDGYEGCDHAPGKMCSRARYKRRLVCNPCEKHKLNHAKRTYNCTPQQLEHMSARLQRACAQGTALGRPKQSKQMLVVKMHCNGQVRRFHMPAPLKLVELRHLCVTCRCVEAASMRGHAIAAASLLEIWLAHTPTTW